MKTKNVLKKCLATLLATTLVLPMMTNVKATEVYVPGVTVEADETSSTGYMAHFFMI